MRIKPLNFCMSDSMPFQQHWEARISENLIKIIEDDDLLMDVRAMLKPGDAITICSYAEDLERDRLRQYAKVRVVQVNQGSVEIVLEEPIVTIPVKDAVVQKMPKEILTVKKEFGGGFIVQDENGHVIERFKTKAEAVELATA